jgi:ElaB/YqjD/DUF883 family membrane-anchored ribosome-binding protein
MTYRDPLYDNDFTSDSDSSGTTDREGGNAANAMNTAREKGQEVAGQMGDQFSQASDAVNEKGQEARQKAGEMGSKAQHKADEGMEKAASGLGQAAEKLREQGQQRGGTMASTATMTADKLDSASQYLRDKDTDQLMSDLESLVRRKPVESLLAAAGIGFVLSKIFR